jgi:hypothetical protein
VGAAHHDSSTFPFGVRIVAVIRASPAGVTFAAMSRLPSVFVTASAWGCAKLSDSSSQPLGESPAGCGESAAH